MVSTSPNAVDTTIPELPAVLSVSDAAQVLQMSRAFVRECIERGELPTTTMSNRTYVLTNALLEKMRDVEKKRRRRLAARRRGLAPAARRAAE